MATDNFSVTSPGQRKKYRRRRGPPALKTLEAYGTTAHHGMTSPEHALHRGRTPSLESMDDDMSHVTFETAPFHVPDSTLSHAELKSWHTSLHNESGGARSLAIYGELRLREALMLENDDKPHSVMLEGARGQDVHLEAFLRVVVDDHGLEVAAKAREEPKSPMQARLRKKRRSRTGSRPKSATKLRPKSATRL